MVFLQTFCPILFVQAVVVIVVVVALLVFCLIIMISVFFFGGSFQCVFTILFLLVFKSKRERKIEHKPGWVGMRREPGRN